MATAIRQSVELKAGGPEDPDGIRAATVLSAYFHAEQTKAFRRLLWRRLAILGSIWLVVSVTTSVLSREAIVAGFLILGAVGCWAAFLEWTAEHRLSTLLAEWPAAWRSVTEMIE